MKKKRTLVIAGCVLVLLAAAGLGAKYYLDRHVWFFGQFIARDAAAVDLRGEELTAADYRQLRGQLPDCEITWNVPFQGGYISSDSETVRVTALNEADIEALAYVPNLNHLDGEACTDYAVLMDFQSRRPECRVTYRVTLGGEAYPNDADTVIVSDPSAQELAQLLPYLPEVELVQLAGQLPEVGELTGLQQAFPGITFRWEVPLRNTTLSSTTTELDISGKTMDYAEADRVLSYLPELEQVNMRGCGLTDEEMMTLAKKYPACFFLWDITVAGLTFSTDVTEMDISGQTLQSAAEIEDYLPYLPKLEKVIMSHCGLDDETMDALNRRHENIRFIWSVRIKNVYVRTDATYFYPFKFDRDMTVDNDDLYPLRYCTDMVCIDIGHMGGVYSCEWAAFMPNLKWLIIGETRIDDLSPLSGLKNLEYLEMFTIPVTDYSPLVGCTGLKDLCMGKTYGDPAPIAQMTWLENLWWSGVHGTQGLPCSNAKEVLEAALPNTQLKFILAHPVADGWRQLPNYFAMRDFMGMFYLT